jgi:hypothetical protein
MGLTQAAVHHGTNDQSRKTADANKQISGCYYQSVDSQESDHPYQVNESIVDNTCDTVRDLAICDGVEKNDAFTSIEQDAENQAKDVQAESIFADSSEIKDTSTLSGQELPGQHAHDNDRVNSVDKATDVNGDPSKDSDHTIDAENPTVDEPNCTVDSVEVKTVGEANDTNGHPSQESDVTVDAENSNIDELDIIHDSSKTVDTNVKQTEVLQKELPVQSAHESEEVNTDCILDSVEVNTVGEENDVHGHCIQEIGVQTDRENSNVDEPNIHDSSKTNDVNAEQTTSIVDDDVEQNDVSPNIIQGLQNKTISKDIGMEKADETTNFCGETTIIDLGKDLSIQGGVETNNATPLEGSSVILGEQNFVQDGVTFIQDLLILVDFNNDEDQTSNSEEFKWNGDGVGGSTDVKHIKKTQEVQNCCP